MIDISQGRCFGVVEVKVRNWGKQSIMGINQKGECTLEGEGIPTAGLRGMAEDCSYAHTGAD